MFSDMVCAIFIESLRVSMLMYHRSGEAFDLFLHRVDLAPGIWAPRASHIRFQILSHATSYPLPSTIFTFNLNRTSKIS